MVGATNPLGIGATGFPLGSHAQACRFPNSPPAANARKPSFSSGMQICRRVSFTVPGLRRVASDAAPDAIDAKRSPVALACLNWVSVLEWFSEPLSTTGGSVCGSSIEPLSPTRYMATPGVLRSNARWNAPGQSPLSAVPELPISWLCAARLIIVKIGVPSDLRACSTPSFVSTAATRSSCAVATEVGNWSEIRSLIPVSSG